MAKRLLSKDYDKFIIGSFTLPENDFYNYYHNIIDEYYELNPDIFEKLSEAIENRIEWYRKKVYDLCTKEDAEEDENGSRIRLINRDEIGYSLLHKFGINRHIDKSFFDLQILAITKISLEHFQTMSENIKQVVKKGYKKPKTFESLFRDKDNARKVKEIFEIREYTINGKWQGLTNDKTELLSAYYVLIPLLKSGQKTTPTARIFYSEFGLSDEFISDRTLRKRPKNIEISNEFENIFSHLLNPSK